MWMQGFVRQILLDLLITIPRPMAKTKQTINAKHEIKNVILPKLKRFLNCDACTSVA